MSTATEISRLVDARNTIRDKLVDLGLATSTAKLDALAIAVDGITNRGAVAATVQEGDTYTIPAGFHNGAGTVTGVSGGGNYTLQSKGPITPTKSSQSITPDNGYYGLSSVAIAAIPEAYQNVSGVTATAGDVLATKIIVDATGASVTGIMPNIGTVTRTLDATTGNQSYTIPAGKHSGSGTVSITLETKSATPTTSSQDIVPTTGKVLSKVTVGAIPSQYKDTTNVDATAADVLAGKTIVTGSGEVEGSMTNNGAVSQVLDVRSGHTSYTVAAGFHNGNGTVSLVTEEKSVTPSASSQDVTPTNGKVLSKVTVAAAPSGTLSNLVNLDDDPSITIDNSGLIHVSGGVGATYHPVSSSGWIDTTDTMEVDVGVMGTYQLSTQAATTITPTTSSQTAVPAGKYTLGAVTVAAIPATYGDTTGDDAVAANLLAGKLAHTIVNGAATQIEGTMTNNGAISGTIDGLTTTSYSVPAGYTSGGTVSLTNDIETALAAI